MNMTTKLEDWLMDIETAVDLISEFELNFPRPNQDD